MSKFLVFGQESQKSETLKKTIKINPQETAPRSLTCTLAHDFSFFWVENWKKSHFSSVFYVVLPFAMLVTLRHLQYYS